MKNKNKIGYCEYGGIFIGKNIETGFHRHYAITIIISLAGSFQISHENTTETYNTCIIQPSARYKFFGNTKDDIAFIYLEPYSEPGLKLVIKDSLVKELKRESYLSLINTLKIWFTQDQPKIDFTESFLLQLSSNIAVNEDIHKSTIDPRIRSCIEAINLSAPITLAHLSEIACLSPSRISHLFKTETGISFKKFQLHSKLIRSIKGIYLQQNLTEASYYGGFADQPHFTRTYLKTFGILPSITKI
jgi:AraC-like DNA-binding protein